MADTEFWHKHYIHTSAENQIDDIETQRFQLGAGGSLNLGSGAYHGLHARARVSTLLNLT